MARTTGVRSGRSSMPCRCRVPPTRSTSICTRRSRRAANTEVPPDERLAGQHGQGSARRRTDPPFPRHRSLLEPRHPARDGGTGHRRFAVLRRLCRWTTGGVRARGHRWRHVCLPGGRVRAAGASRARPFQGADGGGDGTPATAGVAPFQPGHRRRARPVCRLWFHRARAAAEPDGKTRSGHLHESIRPAMNPLLQSTLEHLKALVSFDTRNPPRAITTGGIFDYIGAQLPGFDIAMTDHGAGAISLHAVRGAPKLLFNVHLDTVPDSPAWTADPHELRVTADRAIGLGACDIKGAAAALLAVANASEGDMALLFTTDEEANDPRCIAGFLADRPAYEAVIVAEPTKGEAVLAHRGIQSVLMRFAGHAGHASGEQKPSDSALHQAVRWGNAALDFVAAQSHERFGGLTGLRFNIGRIEGGIKANMIAPSAEVRFGMRPLPTM